MVAGGKAAGETARFMSSTSSSLSPGETVARPAQQQPAISGGNTYPPGSILLTSFRIEALVGSGGMGSVYRATHLLTGATVAVKTIRPEYASDPKLAELFRREAQLLRRIAHPAVVRYEGAFAADDGHMVLVMEFVEGPSLMRVLRDGALPEKAVRALRDRLAAGLAAAHAEGVVHRDLSPDNIILPGGRVEDAKIIDFGIARQERAEGATLVGDDFAGKLAWAAPEQFGLFGGTVDHRADIFTLGLVLAAAAIGRPLEMGTSINSAVHARTSPVDLNALPAGLRKDLQPMLHPDPVRRPESMTALLPLDVRAAWLGARRWRWLAAASLLVAVATTVLSVWEVDEHDPWFGKLFGAPSSARKPTATVVMPPVRDATTVAGTPAGTAADPMTLQGRYGGNACYAKDAPCSAGVLSIRDGRVIGSWPAVDDRLMNMIEGSVEAGGVVRLRWRRLDAGDNLIDQVFLSGTITAARLQASGQWANNGTPVALDWSQVE
jgi:serine/threonine-protein kinase